MGAYPSSFNYCFSIYRSDLAFWSEGLFHLNLLYVFLFLFLGYLWNLNLQDTIANLS